MMGRALLPEWPLDSRCRLIVNQDTGGDGRGPWRWGRSGGGSGQRVDYPSSSYSVLPPSFSISVYQCLVVVKPSHSRAGRRIPDCQQSRLDQLDGPAGPSHHNCRSTSPGETSQRQNSSRTICLREQLGHLPNWSHCKNGANQLWIYSTRTHIHTLNHQCFLITNHGVEVLRYKNPVPNPEKDPWLTSLSLQSSILLRFLVLTTFLQHNNIWKVLAITASNVIRRISLVFKRYIDFV